MKTSCLAVGLAFGVLALSATAQTTNNLNTALGRFESRLDVLVGQGFGDVGTVAFGQEEVRVRALESRNMATGDKIYGLSVDWGKNSRYLRLLVDDDELDGLIDSVTRLTAIKSGDVTSLPGFEANFTTKAGLRVTAHSDRREGTVLTYLQFADSPRISMSSIQIQQLGVLLQQGRKTLDALKAGN
jgi:uncharacterized protein YlbG (UPF0298 family)